MRARALPNAAGDASFVLFIATSKWRCEVGAGGRPTTTVRSLRGLWWMGLWGGGRSPCGSWLASALAWSSRGRPSCSGPPLGHAQLAAPGYDGVDAAALAFLLDRALQDREEEERQQGLAEEAIVVQEEKGTVYDVWAAAARAVPVPDDDVDLPVTFCAPGDEDLPPLRFGTVLKASGDMGTGVIRADGGRLFTFQSPSWFSIAGWLPSRLPRWGGSWVTGSL